MSSDRQALDRLRRQLGWMRTDGTGIVKQANDNHALVLVRLFFCLCKERKGEFRMLSSAFSLLDYDKIKTRLLSYTVPIWDVSRLKR